MVGLCRLCASLRKIDVLVTIKDNTNEICEKLRKCCALNINMYDSLPKSVCQECIEKLNNSYKFYSKVQEAQETLQALYPPLRTEKESEKENESAQSSLEQTVSVLEGNPKEKQSTVVEDIRKLTKGNTDFSVKKLKLENFLIEKTKDNVKEPKADKRKSTESVQTKKDIIQEVYNILHMTKEETICDSSYELLESAEENIEDLTENDLNYRDVCKQRGKSMEEYHVYGENKAQNPQDASNEDDLPPDEIIKQIDNITTENVEVEYMECYENEEEICDVASNIYIEQAEIDDEHIVHLSIPSQLKLNSWKKYKYLCYICDDIFSNFMELKSHIADEHNIKEIDKLQYKCYDCKKIIPRYNFFLNHVRSKHHRDLELKCDVCDLSCQNFEALSHHRSGNCGEARNYADTVPCNQCFKTFHDTFGLQIHYKFQHDSSKSKVKYKCTQCNKEFLYKSGLKSHEQLHTDEKKIFCSYCDRSFYNKLGLEQHLYVHVEEKTYQCNICSKSYKTFQTLNEHQKIHNDIKPFKCQFCDRCFCQKVQKLTHERIHTGKMPYSCKQCDKRFRYRSALIVHRRIHTGDKPYSCEYCVKTFADSSNRNKHMRRIHTNVERKEYIKK